MKKKKYSEVRDSCCHVVVSVFARQESRRGREERAGEQWKKEKKFKPTHPCINNFITIIIKRIQCCCCYSLPFRKILIATNDQAYRPCY